MVADKSKSGEEKATASPAPSRVDSTTVFFWAVSSGVELASYQPYRTEVISIQPNYRASFISCDGEGNIIIWRTLRDSIEIIARRLLDGWEKRKSCEISNEGHLLAAAGYIPEAEIYLWDLESGTIKGRLEGHAGGVTALSFSPDEKFLVSAGYDSLVILWDIGNMKKSAILRNPLTKERARLENREIYSVAYAPHHGRVAAGGIGYVELYDVTSFKPPTILRLPPVPGWSDSHVHKVTFSPNGEPLVGRTQGERSRVQETYRYRVG
jgi:WD40 repeat protein